MERTVNDLKAAAAYQIADIATNQQRLRDAWSAAQPPVVGHVAVEKTPSELRAAADQAYQVWLARSGGPPKP